MPRMVTAQLPPAAVASASQLPNAANAQIKDVLIDWLSDQRISVAVYQWSGRMLCRVTAEVYTTEDEICRLAAAVLSLAGLSAERSSDLERRHGSDQT